MNRVALVGLFIVLGAAPVAAQPGSFGLGQDLRLEGIVDPSDAAKQQALGSIKIRGGRVVRKFAVIRAQTSRTEGMSLFNRSDLHPEQLLLYGSQPQLSVFTSSPAGTRLRMLGRYQGDTYTLAEITTVDPNATPGATPGHQKSK